MLYFTQSKNTITSNEDHTLQNCSGQPYEKINRLWTYALDILEKYAVHKFGKTDDPIV